MKNKVKAILLVIIFLFMTTGCGSSDYIQDENKITITHGETGQMLRNDIICLPDTDSELYRLYEENKNQLKIPFEELPTCTSYKITSNESSGIWEFLFVKPLAFLIMKLGNLVNNLGISLVLIGLAIRVVLLPFTIRSTKQTYNMKKAQPEIAKVEKKYANRTDNEALMAKSQETMLIYKKYKVNPMLGCLVSLIQLPLFFAFLQAIYRLPAIYEETLFGFNLGMSPLKGIQAGEYTYIILLVLIAVSTYFSFKQTLTQTPQSTPEAAKQMKIMVYVMLVVIVYASISLPTALAFYWIVTYSFISIQNIVLNFINTRSFNISGKGKKNKKDKKEKMEKIKDKLVKKEGMKYGKDN